MLRHTIYQTICAPLEPIYNCIADFEKYGKVHPYMVEVKEIAGADSAAKYYAVREQLLLYGFIPMRPGYEVKVTIEEMYKHVQYYSAVAMGVHLTIDFRFAVNEQTGCVEIKEELLLDAPVVIRTVFMGILKRAHVAFYNKLKIHISGIGPGS